MTDSHRPITSKARGICKYYTTERGCFNANSCKFLHSTDPATDPSGSRPPLLTPYDQAKRCKYYAQGYCKRGDECWFVHEKSRVDANAGDDDDDCCSICFDKPSLYGLLGGCNHVFCIDCIRKWRDPSGKGSDISNIKKCPMCRSQCRYIIPSSYFVKDGPEKERIIQNYKDSMARVPCKHFMATKAKNPKKPMCPYGSDCFYQHLNDDGTAYIFPYGAETALKNWNHHNRDRIHPLFNFISDSLDPIDIFERMLSQVMESSAEGRGSGAGRSSEETRIHSLENNYELRRGFISAMFARRARLAVGDDYGYSTRPDFAEAMTPPNWDPESVEIVDNSWIWHDLDADAVENADADAVQLSEFVGDMLGSRRNATRRHTESPVPPLEPISVPRQETPLPPLEPIDAWGTFQDDNEELPALQSVTDSSDSESDEGGDDEPALYSDYNSPNNLPPLESITQPDEEAGPSFNQRFATFERERERTEDSETMDEETEAPHESTYIAPTLEEPEISVVTQGVPTPTQAAVTSHAEAVLESPFVTDGRGRVVWSNKDSTETMAHTQESREDVQPASNAANRLYEWMTGFF